MIEYSARILLDDRLNRASMDIYMSVGRVDSPSHERHHIGSLSNDPRIVELVDAAKRGMLKHRRRERIHALQHELAELQRAERESG